MMLAIFTLMFGGLGSMLLFVGLREFVSQRRTLQNAVVVEATILSARVVSSKSSDTDDRVLRDNSTTSFSPEVRFTYLYGGKAYESQRIYPTVIQRGYASEAEAASEIAAYEVGVTAKAYTDALEPERGFLRFESSIGPMGFIIAGLLSFAFLIVLFRFL